MAEDEISYTPEEVAKLLKISRFTVYELIKRGDLAAFHVGRKVRVDSADIERYKQKSKGIAIPPPPPVSSDLKEPLDSASMFEENMVICGQDIILDTLTRYLEKQFPNMRFLRRQIGSIDGLMALYRGLANVVTAHLWDSDSDDYNLPYVRRLLPGHPVCVYNLVYRMEGFYVAKGNPKSIKTWKDLTKSDVRFVNRETGSGARVLLDEKLKVLRINHREIIGYDDEQMTHLAVASKVSRGEADVGLGVEKVAMQFVNLEFIPLQKERYDLVIRREDLERPHFQAMIQILKSTAFQKEVSGIGGYDLSRMGELIAEV